MKKSIFLFLALVAPIFVISQTVEVLVDLKVTSLNVNAGLITNAADPISPQDAATKAYVDIRVAPTYTVGYSAEQGGYIYWVSPDGKHGIVAETVDQQSTGSDGDDISDPGNHSVDGANFRDWRMPTFYELNEMYVQKENIGGFSNAGYYKSSTGKVLQFGTGAIAKGSFYPLGNKVRAVRTF